MPGQSLAGPHLRYLRLLGFLEPPSGLDGLRRIVSSHLKRVPFENVTKLVLMGREGAGRLTTLDEFLDGIEQRDLGGTCYTSNPLLAGLLGAIGYDASLLGADMRRPNVHTSIRVTVNGAGYHVDVGYAAPFYEPIDLRQLPYTVTLGSFRYVVEHAGPDEYRVMMYAGDEPRHGYRVHPPVRDADFFRQTIVDSFDPGSTFLRCLRISRFFDDGAAELRNQDLTIDRGGRVERTSIESMSHLREVADRVFLMPRCPIEEAVGVLERLNGKAFFGGARWSDRVE